MKRRPKCVVCRWRYQFVMCRHCDRWLCERCYAKHVPDNGTRTCAPGASQW